MDYTATVKTGNQSGRKVIIIAVCVFAAVLVLAAAAFLLRGPATYMLAEKKAENEDFASAAALLEGNSSEKARALADYSALRLDISAGYAGMLTGFDIDTIRAWYNRALEINSDALSEKMRSSASGLTANLEAICTLYDEFTGIRPGILELMDVFNEINSLYDKDSEGNNRTFTIAGERAKISRWEDLLAEVQAYLAKLPSEDKVYLLSYLVKEAHAEITELSATMDRLLENPGITETDEVRANGDGRKVFPSVESSSGVSVNLMDKEPYAEYMFAGVCRALTEYLAGYYTGV